MGSKIKPIAWIRRQFNKLAKWWLNRQAPPGEFIVYINEQEEQLLKQHGGAGEEWQDTGIKSFFFKSIVRSITRAVKSVVKAVTKVVSAIVKPIVKVVDGFLGLFGMSFGAPDMPTPESFDNNNQGILVNKQSNVASLPVVYGVRLLGGTRVFVATEGTDQKFLYVCLAVAEGEIDSYTGLLLNDEEQNISFTTGSVHSVIGGNYTIKGNAKAKFEFFTGTEDQTVSTLLNAHSQWTGEHRLRGVAYVAARFEWCTPEYDNNGKLVPGTNNPFSGIPDIKVKVRGRKVHTGYSASKDTATATSTYETDAVAFSNNPADCLLDYLRNPRYGKGLQDNQISFADFDTLQATCASTTDADGAAIDFGGALGTGNPAFVCNAVIQTSQSVFENTKLLLQSFRGFMPYLNGKYSPSTEGKLTTSQIADLQLVDDTVIVSPITVSSMDKNSKYNEVKLTFANEQKNYESDNIIVSNSTYLTEDSGETLVLNSSSQSITRYERALSYAKYLVDRSRSATTVQFTVSNEGQNIQPGQVIKLQHRYTAPGSEAESTNHMFDAVTDSAGNICTLYRVSDCELQYDHTVKITAVEHLNDIYTVAAVDADRDLSPAQAVKIHVPRGQSGHVGSTLGGNNPPVDPNPNASAVVSISTTASGGLGSVIVKLISGIDSLSPEIEFSMVQNGNVNTRMTDTQPRRLAHDYFFGGDSQGNSYRQGDRIDYTIQSKRSFAEKYLIASGTVYIGGSSVDTSAGSNTAGGSNSAGSGWSE
jgi:hypothetical protein